MLQYFLNKARYIPFRTISLNEQKHICLRNISNANKPRKEFTIDEQKYILNKLNEADVAQLERFSLPKHRIKKLDNWRKRNGKFHSLDDVLEIEGLGMKSLDRLCKNILTGERENDKPVKSRGQYLTPLLSATQIKDLKSALGIHLYATGVSWARIQKENNTLTDWDYFEFDFGTKKMTPADTLQLVVNASINIPPSDIYVIETPISVTPTAQQNSISVSAYVQRVQLLSMLITILSTSLKHNPKFVDLQRENVENLFDLDAKVYFLRHRLPARLFRTLVGTERVSAAATVSNIFENKENTFSAEKIVYTPISFETEFCTMYQKQMPITKEVLGQALLLIMSFMDICIYQNPNSLKALISNNR